MTARRADIADLPAWPRGLSLEQAAAYVGVTPPTFAKHVRVTPIRIGGRVLYDRTAIDRWLDDAATGGNPDASNDQWLERLDAGQDSGG